MNNRMSMTCSSSSSSSGCSSAAVLAGAGLLPFRLLAGPNACPAPTQPIVYYAQVPQLYGKKQKGQEIKNKPNHFVKAFHWYKREHCANKKTAVDKFDIGFATWLDHKYEQYLRDKSMLDTNFKSEASNVQTPTVNQDVGFYKSAKPKGLRRVLKSPWKKRHSADKTPEGGICCTEYKESWHTILRPKSLSRIESLSCAQKRSNEASSKITMTSSDAQVFIRVERNRDDITARSDDVSYVNKTFTDKDKDTPNIDELYSKNKLGRKKRKKSKIVKCECPLDEKKISSNYKTDTITQYDSNINTVEKPLKYTTETNVTSKSDILNKSTELVTPTATKNSYAARSKETIVLGKKNTDSNKYVEEIKPFNNRITTPAPIQSDYSNKSTASISAKHDECQKLIACPCPMHFADNAAQTSDYAITPGHVTRCFPLLLRVVPTKCQT